MRQYQHQELAFTELQEIVELETALALLDLVGLVAALALGEQLA